MGASRVALGGTARLPSRDVADAMFMLRARLALLYETIWIFRGMSEARNAERGSRLGPKHDVSAGAAARRWHSRPLAKQLKVFTLCVHL